MPGGNDAQGVRSSNVTRPDACSGEPETKVCEHCGDEFVPYRKSQLYCPGGICRRAAWRARRDEQLVEEVRRQERRRIKERIRKALED